MSHRSKTRRFAALLRARSLGASHIALANYRRGAAVRGQHRPAFSHRRCFIVLEGTLRIYVLLKDEF